MALFVFLDIPFSDIIKLLSLHNKLTVGALLLSSLQKYMNWLYLKMITDPKKLYFELSGAQWGTNQTNINNWYTQMST